VRTINRAIPKPGRSDYVERSDKVFTSPRLVKFCEMEYGFPRADAVAVIGEVRRFLTDGAMDIGFPIEVRFTAADDIPLSMASGRASCFIACHVFKGQPYEEYFRGIEGIMRAVGGRPHWGKLHFQDADSLAGLYPQWEQFQAVRRRLDPDGRFANAYTDRVFGR
jgi:L-gulono-1,4-lactone dehydrogenase